MGKWLQYSLLLSIISVNGWAAELYQIELPRAPSITIEVRQKSHALSAAEQQSVANELKILSQNTGVPIKVHHCRLNACCEYKNLNPIAFLYPWFCLCLMTIRA
jgi:hypothetical protein